MFEEDTHKHFTTGEATLNLSFLRMMAYNLLQMRRRHEEKKKTWDKRSVWETWDRTFKQFLVAFEQHYSRTIISQEAMLKT